MANDVLKFKDAAKKWYNHACIKYMQDRELTDEQEAFLEEISEFITNAIDTLEGDSSFLRKILLPPVKLPKGKTVEL